MNNDLKQCLSEKRAAFLIEEEKEYPDCDTLEELKASIFYLEKAQQEISLWMLEKHNNEAQELCKKTEEIIEKFQPNDINDIQRLAH